MPTPEETRFLDLYLKHVRRGELTKAFSAATQWLETTSLATPERSDTWRSLFLVTFDEYGCDMVHAQGAPFNRADRFGNTDHAMALYDHLFRLAEKGSDPFRDLQLRHLMVDADAEGARVHPLLVFSEPANGLRERLRRCGEEFLTITRHHGASSALLRCVVLGEFDRSVRELVHPATAADAPSGEEIAYGYWLLSEMLESRNRLPGLNFEKCEDWSRKILDQIQGVGAAISVARREIDFLWKFESVLDLAYAGGKRIESWERRNDLKWGSSLLERGDDMVSIVRMAVGHEEPEGEGRSATLANRLRRMVMKREPMSGWSLRLTRGARALPDTFRRRLRVALRRLLSQATAAQPNQYAEQFLQAVSRSIANTGRGASERAMLDATVQILCHRPGEQSGVREALQVLQRSATGEERASMLSTLAYIALDVLLLAETRVHAGFGAAVLAPSPLKLLLDQGAEVAPERLQSGASVLAEDLADPLIKSEYDLLTRRRPKGRGRRGDNRLETVLATDNAGEFEELLYGTFIKEFDRGALEQLDQAMPEVGGYDRKLWEKAFKCREAFTFWVSRDPGNNQPAIEITGRPDAEVAQSLRERMRSQAQAGRLPDFGRPALHLELERFLRPFVAGSARTRLAPEEISRRRSLFLKALTDDPVSVEWFGQRSFDMMPDTLGRNLVFVLASTGHGSAMELAGRRCRLTPDHFRATHDGVTPLMAAVRVAADFDEEAKKMVEELLRRAPDHLDKASRHGIRPIHLAYRMGHKQVADLLIQSGAKVDVQSGDRTSIVLEAIASGDPGVLSHALERLGRVPASVRQAVELSPERIETSARDGDSVPFARKMSALRLAMDTNVGSDTAGEQAAVMIFAEFCHRLPGQQLAESVNDELIDALIGSGQVRFFEALLGNREARGPVVERVRDLRNPPALDRVVDAADRYHSAGAYVPGAEARDSVAKEDMFRLLIDRCEADRPLDRALQSVKGGRNLLTRLLVDSQPDAGPAGPAPAGGGPVSALLRRVLDPLHLAAHPEAKAYVAHMLAQRDEEYQDYPIALANQKRLWRCAMMFAAALDVPQAEAHRVAAQMLFRMLVVGPGLADGALPKSIRGSVRFEREGDGHRLSWAVPAGLQPAGLSKASTGLIRNVQGRDSVDDRSMQVMLNWLTSGELRALIHGEWGVTVDGFCNWLWWSQKHETV